MTYKSEFLQTLARRGYIHQLTDADAIDARAAKPGLIAYVGFDLTGPSLHIGHLMSIMMLRRLQQHGGKPIALMGGGTTKVGDPSGKDSQRQMLDQATIDANKASIRRVFERFLTFGDGPSDAIMADTLGWVAASAPDGTGTAIRWPGSRVPEVRARNLAQGIPVDERVWQSILALQPGA